MRTVVPRMSKGQQREVEDRRAAVLLQPRMPDGSTSILVVGNSLLLHGIDRARLQREMGSRYHVVLYPIEGTTYLDWYFGLRRLFADGARPSRAGPVHQRSPISLQPNKGRGICPYDDAHRRFARGRPRWSPQYDDSK